MTCGPVLIHRRPGAGAVASVLLASLPSTSMKTKPTLLGGSVLFTNACSHSMPLASRHIGSGPGVPGSSGMQVHPLEPGRSVRMLPSAFIATMVAAPLTGRGAAAIALAISCASVRGRAAGVAACVCCTGLCGARAGGCCCASAGPASIAIDARNTFLIRTSPKHVICQGGTVLCAAREQCYTRIHGGLTDASVGSAAADCVRPG